jgi:transcription antitermination factor NusG
VGGDRRDDDTWVVVELTKQGEQRVEEGSLREALLKDLNAPEDLPLFIPAMTYAKEDRAVTIHLLEGYVFIAARLPEVAYFGLESQPYVSQVLSVKGDHGMRVLSTIPNREIKALRKRLHEQVATDIVPDTLVRVLEGVYRELEGRVESVDGDHATVAFRLRSLRSFIGIPLVFLENIGTAEPKSGVPAPEQDDDEEEFIVAPQPLPTERPTARFFYQAVVYAIAEAAGFREDYFVTMEDVLPKVLLYVGIDPDDLPSEWELEGYSGLYRRIGFAFRNQREKYCRQPLTVLGTKRGLWGLNADGIKLARKIASERKK